MACSEPGALGGDGTIGQDSGPPPWEYIETGDLSEIRARGKLRFVDRTRPEIDYLPRDAESKPGDRDLARLFAERIGVELVFVRVPTEADIVRYLVEGKGDIALGRLTPEHRSATDLGEFADQVTFTIPNRTVTAQLVIRADDNIEKEADLAGRRLVLQQSSPFAESVNELRAKVSGIEFATLPEDIHPEQILHRVAISEYDVTVVESETFETFADYSSELTVAFELGAEVDYVGMIRASSTELLRAANEFLVDVMAQGDRPLVYTDDLPGIREKGVLRVLTLNSPSTYFMWRGELVGFEFALVEKLADELDLALQMITVPTAEDLIPWLREGRGDVVAAGLAPRPEGAEPGAAYSRPYHYVSPVIVSRLSDQGIGGPADLAGRTLVLPPSSPFWSLLEATRDSGVDLELQPAPAVASTEEIVESLATADYDLLLEESHRAAIEISLREDIKEIYRFEDEAPHVWAIRSANTELLDTVNAYFDREYRGTFYNIIRKRNFEDFHGTVERYSRRIRPNTPEGAISPYDDLAQKYADRYGVEWRLIVAQMYAESRFDASARSSAGARGLLQVLPRTAAEFGFHNLEDPEEGLHAGVRYLVWLLNRFEPTLPTADRMAFALASYNAGYGHVRDARIVAKRQGWNPDRWLDNVERAMLLLSRRDIANTVRYGYCRGSEPVRYVREILQRARMYLSSADD